MKSATSARPPRAATALNKKIPTPPEELVPLLRNYPFPGNVRELKTLLFDAASRHKDGILALDVFKAQIRRYRSREGPAAGDEEYSTAPGVEGLVFPKKLPTIKQAAELLVAEAMKRASGNQTIAASMLGITQQALSKRLKKTEEH